MAIELKEPGMEPERNMRSQTPSLLCPICNMALTMSDRQGVEIDYCPQCRGVWLDRGELDKIIERSAVETELPQRRPDPRDYEDRGGRSYAKHGGHGGYGKHSSRRKSWLMEIFD